MKLLTNDLGGRSQNTIAAPFLRSLIFQALKICCWLTATLLMIMISIGNYTVREVLMKNRTRVWRNVYNTASA